MEELKPHNICTYCPNNPAFDPKRVLLRRLFFINEDRTEYVSVGFYPARDYLPLVDFGVVRRGGGRKTLILSDEQVDAQAEALPTLWDDMCSGETSVGGSQVREWCIPAGFDTQTASGTSIRRFTVYFSDFTIYGISLACSVLCNNNCVIISWHFKTCCPMLQPH